MGQFGPLARVCSFMFAVREGLPPNTRLHGLGESVQAVVYFSIFVATPRAGRTPAQNGTKQAGFPGINIERGLRVMAHTT